MAAASSIRSPLIRQENRTLPMETLFTRTASLRYAHWDGTSWNDEILEGAGDPGTSRQAVMLILDKHDIPHIAYSDVVNGIVKVRNPGQWKMAD